jgi:hypothetical protein
VVLCCVTEGPGKVGDGVDNKVVEIEILGGSDVRNTLSIAAADGIS